MTKIEIQTKDGQMSGYLAEPVDSPLAGMIVLQEIFGVNKVMRDLCDELARQGFLALCPDLFWRIEPNIDITDQTKQEWDKAFDLFGKFDGEKGVADIVDTITALKARPTKSGKIGAIGFCLGGGLAYLTAARTKIDASCGFYGVNIDNHLAEVGNIKKPLMLHIAGRDQFVPPEAQAKIKDALEKMNLIHLHHYPKRDHAFARVGGEHYHAEDAALAWQRSLMFFKENLN